MALACGATLLAFAAAAQAVTSYKWVDEDGRVTYQETPPPPGSGGVEKKSIDPDQNVIPEPRPAPAAEVAPRMRPPDDNAATGAPPAATLTPAGQAGRSGERDPATAVAERT